MMLACLALDIPHPWANLKLPQIIRKVISLKEYQGNVLGRWEFCFTLVYFINWERTRNNHAYQFCSLSDDV